MSQADSWPTESGLYYHYRDGHCEEITVDNASSDPSADLWDGYLVVDGSIRFVAYKNPIIYRVAFGCKNISRYDINGLFVADMRSYSYNEKESPCCGKNNTLWLINKFGMASNDVSLSSIPNEAVACSKCRNIYFNDQETYENRGYMPSMRELVALHAALTTLVSKLGAKNVKRIVMAFAHINSNYLYYSFWASNVPIGGGAIRTLNVYCGLIFQYRYSSGNSTYQYYDSNMGVSQAYDRKVNSSFRLTQYGGDSTYNDQYAMIIPCWCPGGDYVEADGSIYTS